jgi:hypothetical protein
VVYEQLAAEYPLPVVPVSVTGVPIAGVLVQSSDPLTVVPAAIVTLGEAQLPFVPDRLTVIVEVVGTGLPN